MPDCITIDQNNSTRVEIDEFSINKVKQKSFLKASSSSTEYIFYTKSFSTVSQKASSFSKYIENLRKIFSYIKLPDNWNGNGAKGFDPELVNRVIDISSRIEQQPEVFPTARNSIQFEYEKDNGDYLEIEIFIDKFELFQANVNGNREETHTDFQLIPELINRFYA